MNSDFEYFFMEQTNKNKLFFNHNFQVYLDSITDKKLVFNKNIFEFIFENLQKQKQIRVIFFKEIKSKLDKAFDFQNLLNYVYEEFDTFEGKHRKTLIYDPQKLKQHIHNINILDFPRYLEDPLKEQVTENSKLNHQELVQFIKVMISDELKISISFENQDFSAEINIDQKQLFELVKTMIEHINKSIKLIFKKNKIESTKQKNYKQDMILVCMHEIYQKYEYKKRVITNILQKVIYGSSKYPFQNKMIDLDNLTWHQIFKKIHSYKILNFVSTVLEDSQNYFDQRVKEVTCMILNERIHPMNHLTQIQIQFLEESKKLSQDQRTKFVSKILDFVNDPQGFMQNQIKEVFMASNADAILKREITRYIKEMHIKQENNFRTLVQFINIDEITSLFYFGYYFQGQLKMYEEQEDEELRILYPQENDQEKIDRMNYDNFQKFVQTIYLYSLENEQLDRYADKIYSLIIQKDLTGVLVDYQKMTDFCCTRCEYCGGICTLMNNHKNDHAFFHVPRLSKIYENTIFKNMEGTNIFDCMVRNSVQNETDIFLKDSFYEHHSYFFWKWILLRYHKEVKLQLGIENYLIDLNNLNKRDVQIMNMSADEVIDRL